MSVTGEPLIHLSANVSRYLQTQKEPSEDISEKAEEFLDAVAESNYAQVEKSLRTKDFDINYTGRKEGVHHKRSAMMIAAGRNDFYMIKLLYDYEAKPLDNDMLEGTKNLTIDEKIRLYDGLSSPAYISISYLRSPQTELSARDCVQEAFELIKEMKEFVRKEKLEVLKEKYEVFKTSIQRLETFTIDLLNCCHTTDEIGWFMEGRSHDKSCCGSDRRSGACTCAMLTSCAYDGYAKHFRVAENAIQTRQKVFIAQPQVQTFLREKWLYGQPDWSEKQGILWRVLYCLFAFFVYGILREFIPVHIFDCKTTWLHRVYYSPKAAFLSHHFTYTFFLVLVFTYQVVVSYEVEDAVVVVSSDVNYVPILVLCVVWFAGLCIADLRQAIFQGPSRYFTNHWNLLDVTILVTFFIGVIVSNPEIVGQSQGGDPYILIYLSKFTSLTFICALLRFMEPFYLSYYIGPILLIFTEMRHDIIRFILVFAYVIGAYALAMYYFYVGIGENQTEFAYFPSSLRSLVLAIFGGDATASLNIEDIVLANMTGVSHSANMVAYFVAVGYILYVLFGIIVLIMLLNLCIAMMSDSYSRLKADLDLEWKFQRSRIWMEYTGDRGANSNVLSFVFYLILSLFKPIVMIIRYLCCKMRKNTGVETELNNVSVTEEDGIFAETKYVPCTLHFDELLNLLLTRYFDKHAKPLGDSEDRLEEKKGK